jgi:integrase
VKLTAAYLKTLRPGPKYQEITDDLAEGLRIVVRPSGAKSWVYRYSFAGSDRKVTIGKLKRVTLEVARERARQLHALVALGRDPRAEKVQERREGKASKLTVKKLGEKALAHLELRPKSRAEFTRLHLKEIVPAFGKLPAPDLTRQAIRAWSDSKAKTAPVAANRAFEVLRRFYSWGVERDLLTSTPFVNLRKPAREKSSERVLSGHELWALQRALNEIEAETDPLHPWMQWTKGSGPDAVRLLLLTGARREMVLGARREEFEDLDGLDPRWVIPGSRMKSGRPHVVPLSMQAVKLVSERLRLTPGPYVFPAGQARNGKTAKRETIAWKSAFVERLRKRVEAHMGSPVPRWTIHNIRHSVATRMVEDLGVSPHVVSLILGHAFRTGPSVTAIYQRADMLKERRAAFKEWANELERYQPPGKVLQMRAKEA